MRTPMEVNKAKTDHCMSKHVLLLGVHQLAHQYHIASIKSWRHCQKDAAIFIGSYSTDLRI